MPEFLLIVSAYLIGSFPTAYLFGRFLKKVDIRTAGSGNVGGMNIYRVAGLLPGILTILIDAGKGALAACMALSLSGEPLAVFSCIFMVVLGHNYSLFLKFKGGKGLATTLGAFLVLSPASILFAVICAVGLAFILRDTNTAFGCAALSIPPILWIQYRQWDWLFLGLALALIIAVKHLPDCHAYRQGRRKIT